MGLTCFFLGAGGSESINLSLILAPIGMLLTAKRHLPGVAGSDGFLDKAAPRWTYLVAARSRWWIKSIGAMADSRTLDHRTTYDNTYDMHMICIYIHFFILWKGILWSESTFFEIVLNTLLDILLTKL